MIFRREGRIITNGFALTIEAEVLELDDAPRIISFNKLGDLDDRNPEVIMILANEVKGTSLVIRNTGQDGKNGAQGVKGVTGPPGAQGRATTLESVEWLL